MARRKLSEPSVLHQGMSLFVYPGDIDMRRAKCPVIRNKIDLTDPNQVRAWKRRLGISTDDLQRVVEKVGESISAVNKVIELERAPANTVQGMAKRPSF
jgi:hypothetical protein